MRMREWTQEVPAVEEELDRLFRLDQACFHPGIAYTRAELHGFLAHPSAFSVLIEDAPARAQPFGELLGFAIGRTMRSRGKVVLHIITIDVALAARRRGVGTRLMEWMAAKARELRVEALKLEVAVDNEAALRFYRSLGFAEVGRIPGYYLNAIDALVLECEVAERSPAVQALLREKLGS